MIKWTSVSRIPGFQSQKKKRNNNEEESEYCGVGLKPAACR